MTSVPGRVPGSFRDPSGVVFRKDGVLFRRIGTSYWEEWHRISESGLLAALVERGAVPSFEVLERDESARTLVIQPEELPFVSHPWEWSFGMLKEAALLTLSLAKEGLAKGFQLKDASGFNVLFQGGRPVFIDHLSFESRSEGEPWIAYGQFCRHFLAPLALMSRAEIGLQDLLASHLDGVPLPLASHLLPWSTRFSPGLLTHIHLHASAEKGMKGGDGSSSRAVTISREGLEGLLQSLEKTIEGLHWTPRGTEWADYGREDSYSDEAALAKERVVGRWLAGIRYGLSGKPRPSCWDLGANKGRFSLMAENEGFFTLALDFDPGAVELAWRHLARNPDLNLHPVRANLLDPPPGRGWKGEERPSLVQRGPADVGLALALVHHLSITGGVPLALAVPGLLALADSLILEWVPKEDSQVKRMLRSRKDVFGAYTEEGLIEAIPATHRITAKEALPGSLRVLYLVEKR